MKLTLHEALLHARIVGGKVRPATWVATNPRHWVECRTHGGQEIFVECGTFEEMPHALRLQTAEELLGAWEIIE